ncbi:hypothetical protein DFQ28_004941 [Apophysomyces sp. BC1034]|nr:hypothetical protein DFQ30_000987 [Apophysomyces sp. BC1015]KAG0180613.1 hypothetical protein DFQ29_000323 [Apophysomyces sp. BC1021]KAG0188365.1 hypothetical protein DFQ28_004941 [Apophysomyces sp. BC1034]
MRILSLATILVIPFALCATPKPEVDTEKKTVEVKKPDIITDLTNGFLGLAEEIKKQLDNQVLIQSNPESQHEEGTYSNLVTALFPAIAVEADDPDKPVAGLLNLPSSLISSIISSLFSSLRTWNPLKITTKTLQQLVASDRGSSMVQDLVRGLGTMSSMLPVATEIGQAFLSDAANIITQAVPMLSGMAKTTASLLGVQRGEIHQQDVANFAQSVMSIANKFYPFIRPFLIIGYNTTLSITRFVLSHSPRVVDKISNISRANVQSLVQAAEIMLHL